MELKADCVSHDIGENVKRERSGASFSVTSTGFLRCSLSEVSERSSDRGYKGDPLDECIKSAGKRHCKTRIIPFDLLISKILETAFNFFEIIQLIFPHKCTYYPARRPFCLRRLRGFAPKNPI